MRLLLAFTAGFLAAVAAFDRWLLSGPRRAFQR